MFKIVTVLAICWLSLSQAFDCEIPCLEHSKCVAQDKCECDYGYQKAIGELDGLPYCQWQGTTTTQKTPNSNDNADFHGDYTHEEDQKLDVEDSTSKVNGKPKLPVIMEESQTVVESNDNEIIKEITTKIAAETSTETNAEINTETSTETTMETDTETDTEINTETATEITTETNLETTTAIPTTSEIPDLKTTTQETNAVLPFNADESDHDHDDAAVDFKKPQLNNVNQKENFSNVNSPDTTTEDMEVTTIRSTLIPVVRITNIVEQISYKSTATQTFYTFLGILCPSLAFIFAVAVLFDCVKL